MSNESYNVVFKKEFVHQGIKKVRWVQIGRAWPARNGKGFNLVLETLPAGGATFGDLQLCMFPATDRHPGTTTGNPIPRPDLEKGHPEPGPPGEDPPPPTQAPAESNDEDAPF